MFLWERALDPVWNVRNTSSGELVSLLCGPYASVKRVAVDPPPCPGVGSGMLPADREAVLDRLVDRGGRGANVRYAGPPRPRQAEQGYTAPMSDNGGSSRQDPGDFVNPAGARPHESGGPSGDRREERGPKPEHAKVEPDVTVNPTPIRISKRTRTVLILAVLAMLAYMVYLVPSVLTTAIAGIALALVLSFPVGLFSRFMPRGLAVLLSFLLVVGLVVLAALYLLPFAAEQLVALFGAVPAIADGAERYLNDALNFLQNRGLLPSDPDEVASRVRNALINAAQTVASYVFGGTLSVVTTTVNFLVTLVGAVFVGAYLLIDVRRIEAAWLRAAPHGYRDDAKSLWEAFGSTLSRYLGGLGLILLIQGAVSAVGLFFIGVPYALILGAFVSVTAIIPYLGAFLGAVPAVLVALATGGLDIALLTALLFLGVQQLEGNLLTPKIQGDTLHVHPVLVFLGVIVGGGLGGIFGVIVAVPALAVLRVLFDFLRVRLVTDG